ncbi:polysaccharide deacetylase family protein [Candidatus Poribacteria bacterium]|nr:polysaccharide deacetylase family protein [Candidatus Poribacteria bacterium]
MKIALKKMMFAALSLAGNFYQTEGVPVLGYHSIDDEPSPISTPVKMFRAQMEYLKNRRINVISLGELYNNLVSGKELPTNSAVITFDDGFEGVFHHALPILKELGFRATVFVATNFVGKHMDWEKVAGIPVYRLCDWGQFRKMNEEGIDVQSHTMSHPFLPELEEKQISAEVEGSMKAIEENLDKKVEFLAYPFGVSDERVIRILKANGIKGACSGMFGKVRKEQDPYCMKRVGIELVSGRDFRMLMNFFCASVSGTASWYIWLRNNGVPFLVKRPTRSQYAKH